MLADALLLGGIVAAFLFSVYRLGTDAARSDNDRQVLDDIDKANKARDELLRDPAAARRVRERFTRKLL